MRVLAVLVFALLLLPYVVGCAGSSMRIETFPEGAEVMLLRPGQTPVVLGSSPVTINQTANPEVFTGAAGVRISKAGFLPESVLVPQTRFSTTSVYSLKLQQVELPESCSRQGAAASDLARGVATVQGLIANKDYIQAESALRSLVNKFPDVSVLHDLLGNLYYIQKDVARALAAYRASNNLEPNNSQTTRMIDKLSVISGESYRKEKQP